MVENLQIQKLKARVLSAQLIPAPHADILDSFQSKSKQESYGLLKVDFDHALFVALDEATKASPIRVLYTRSYFATGEGIAVIAGADDEIIREGIKSIYRALDSSICYYTTQGTTPLPFFSHVVSSCGEYLSQEAKLPQGESLAYLLAPPMESIVALDAAIKSADVKQIKFFAPPTESNRGGAFLTGALSECQAAAYAFSQTMERLSHHPLQSMDYIDKKPNG